MSEQLYIRMGWHEQQTCHWLVHAEATSQIIASGEIKDPIDLVSLQVYAKDRPVTVFVSASAMTLHQVELPEKGQRQAIKAIPFLLEEQIAEDVNKLHFVNGVQVENCMQVAVVAIEQMNRWLTWLREAGLKVDKLIPDCLALPQADEYPWSALKLDDQWIIRTSSVSGMTVDEAWLPVVIERALSQETAEATSDEASSEPSAAVPKVAMYSAPPDTFPLAWIDKSYELPMLALVKGQTSTTINLLKGAYRPKVEYGKHLKVWQAPAVAAAFFFVVYLSTQALSIYRHNQEIVAMNRQIVDIYQQIQPNSKLNANLIKNNLQSKLSALQRKGSAGHFFAMLKGLQPAIEQVDDVALLALRFDAKRDEIRLDIRAEQYSQVESFKKLMEDHFVVGDGVMNKRDGITRGSIVLRGK
jgi:general secretion pathway protein L